MDNIRVILEIVLVFILNSSKNDVSIKITIYSKSNNNELQVQW
jgi:hypothetical protein